VSGACRPVIGLPVQRRTPDDGLLSLAPAYVDALVRAGAAPLVLPLLGADAAAPLLALCDGFLLTGSVADVHPRRYAGPDAAIPDGGYCDRERDALDWAVLDHAAAADKPVFGICRGCQAMNVYRGGTLAWRINERWPDAAVEHMRSDERAGLVHAISWEKGSRLAARMPAPEQGVNSLHRQACDRVASSLRVAAIGEDGVVEAIEDVRRPDRFFAVQWHPELLAGGDTPAAAASRALFEHFVSACRAPRGA